MIPRFKPLLDGTELQALFRASPDAVAAFEAEFAKTFRVRQAIAFAYGRSALWALFKVLELRDAEIVMPAYTCVVVAHATVLSGNIPRFVEISLTDYTMDLDLMAAAITPRTGAIIATHLFGHPQNVDRLNSIVQQAEARLGHRIHVIHDCAHSFGAEWQKQPVYQRGTAGLFGLGISKMITSIFGGILTTDDVALAERLRAWRSCHMTVPRRFKSLQRRLYLMAVYAAFWEPAYGLVQWIESHTPFLDCLSKAYHLDGKIHFPPDFQDQMLDVEAAVGRVQLRKYPHIIQRRREHARYYSEQLRDTPGLTLPPSVDGATYSHYAVRVPERAPLVAALRARGVELGELIQYSVPDLPGYRPYVKGMKFPLAEQCSRCVVNLPVYATLTDYERERVAAEVKSAAKALWSGHHGGG